MNIAKKIFLRLFKNIEIYAPQNIRFGKGHTLSNGSILNAQQGNISLGKNTRIGNSSELVAGKNKTIEIKDYTTLYSNCKVLGAVTIERYGVLATNIYMSSGNHFAFKHPELLIKIQDQLVRKEMKDISQPIHIHEDVWIGNGVFISQGITIGRGAIVGAGAIVTKDILPYQVVVGNPARPIKKRLDFNPPAHIKADKQEDLPYFYQGFDHYQLPEHRAQNGIQLIDKGIVKLKLESEILTIKGTATQPFQMEVSTTHISETIKQPKGDFTISIKNTKLIGLDSVSLEIIKGNPTQVFVTSIMCK